MKNLIQDYSNWVGNRFSNLELQDSNGTQTMMEKVNLSISVISSITLEYRYILMWIQNVEKNGMVLYSSSEN